MAIVLTELQQAMLILIKDEPGITGKRVAKELNMSTRHQLIYPFLDFAEINGIIRKEYAPEERGRPHKLFITKQGEQILEGMEVLGNGVNVADKARIHEG